MANVTGTIRVSATFAQTPSGLPGQSTAQSNPQAFGCVFGTSGVLADQVDQKYSNTLAFVASTPQVLDLKSLLDVFGGAVAFARVRSITLKLKSGIDGVVLKVGYATTTANSWVGMVTNPGQLTIYSSSATNDGSFTWTAPNTTGAPVGTSNRLLNLDPGLNAFSVDIEIAGCSV